MNNEEKRQLQTVLNKVNTSCIIKATGMPLIMLPDDHYFVERTLIELGYLKGDKNMCAHKAYLDLMAELGCALRYGTPHNRDFARGAACITTDKYPWQVSCTKEGSDYAADIHRRCAIYEYICKAMQGVGIIQPTAD